jgi:hypothetical protein
VSRLRKRSSRAQTWSGWEVVARLKGKDRGESQGPLQTTDVGIPDHDAFKKDGKLYFIQTDFLWSIPFRAKEEQKPPVLIVGFDQRLPHQVCAAVTLSSFFTVDGGERGKASANLSRLVAWLNRKKGISS